MSAIDKLKNAAQGFTGKGKQRRGRATGDRHLEREGHADQSSADLKQAGEKVKDAFKKK